MSIWVSLIGGLHDGEVAKVDVDQVEIIKRKAVPPPVSRVFNGGQGIMPATVEMKPTRYTRRSVTTTGGTVIFFAIDAFSDLEALQHALGP